MRNKGNIRGGRSMPYHERRSNIEYLLAKLLDFIKRRGEISDPSNAAGYDTSSNQLGIEDFSSEKPTNEFQSGCGWTPVYAASAR